MLGVAGRPPCAAAATRHSVPVAGERQRANERLTDGAVVWKLATYILVDYRRKNIVVDDFICIDR